MYKTSAFKQRGFANVAGFAKISAGPYPAAHPSGQTYPSNDYLFQRCNVVDT